PTRTWLALRFGPGRFLQRPIGEHTLPLRPWPAPSQAVRFSNRESLRRRARILRHRARCRRRWGIGLSRLVGGRKTCFDPEVVPGNAGTCAARSVFWHRRELARWCEAWRPREA